MCNIELTQPVGSVTAVMKGGISISMDKKAIDLISFSNKHPGVWIGMLLAFAIFSVYQPVLTYDAINFDDDQYVFENPQVKKGLTLDGLIWAFTETHAANWHPVTWLSHMLDCSIFGLDPGMHHLTNLILHVLNSLLLLFIFDKMTGSVWKSAFAAGLFALHPLHVESVAWIAERKDVLCTLFWLLAIWRYHLWVQRPTVSRYAGCLLFFGFSLMSKPMAVALPFVLVLMDLWPLKRMKMEAFNKSLSKGFGSLFRLIWEKALFFLLSAAVGMVTLYAQKTGGSVTPLDAVPFAARMANAIVSYAVYMIKTVYPNPLAIFYPFPDFIPLWKLAGGVLLLSFFTAIAARAFKKAPYVMMGWLWYLITLAPVIGIVKVGHQAMADRYTYIPLMGLFIIAAWGVPALADWCRFKKGWLAVASIFILALLWTVTHRQVRYWENSTTLFAHTIAVTKDNWLVHNNLGLALMADGQAEKAIEQYKEAISIKPGYVDAYNNLGLALLNRGDINEAILQYRMALGIRPNDMDVRNNLGLALFNKGHADAAIAHFLEVLRIKPDLAVAHNNIGLAYFHTGRIEKAIEHYQEAVRLRPDYAKAHNNLAVAIHGKGEFEGALKHFRMAIQIDPDYAEAKFNLKKALKLLEQKP